MRVGWLLDQADAVGGAELTQAEFRAAAPEGVEIVDCPAGGVVPDLDLYVVHNCVTYFPEDLEALEGREVVKYWHDIGPWLQDGVREWLDLHARYICCSPPQAEFMQIDADCIPPPVNLDRFSDAASRVNGNRNGAVCVASWRNAGKGQRKAMEWGDANGGLDIFGGGHLAPPGSQEVGYDRMPELLASYRTFVFLPTVIEPFGRLVAEAWAAGCEVVTNNLVGAKWWIENKPEALGTAARDFWKAVLDG
jgi:glycosyltransferase involved in cell wall biosynthesis